MTRLFGTIARIVGSVHTSSARDAMKTIQIRAVIFREGDTWCGQCLEHDIAAEGSTLSELKIELEAVLSIHTELAYQEGKEPFSALPPAPLKYFQMFEAITQSDGIEENHSIESRASVANCVLARFAYSNSVFH